MQPFIKWAGGKRQLIPAIYERLPETYNTYYEPFLGGGAVLFSLNPNKAVVSDVNKVLVSAYKQIKKNVTKLMKKLDELTNEHNLSINKKEFYYLMRARYNELLLKEDYDLETVALFIYLNKTCFNGLYRVNAKGGFNVPFNNKDNVKLYEKENLIEMSLYLKGVKIRNCDFEKTVKSAQEGDFVFFDSPYAPLKEDSFESYTATGFSLSEHQRLAKVFKELDQRGVYCMLTNHNTDLINELYKDFHIDVVSVKRMINRNAAGRKGEEVIIKNY